MPIYEITVIYPHDATTYVEAETSSKAKYKLWCSVGDVGFWKGFIAFLKSITSCKKATGCPHEDRIIR